MNTRIALTLLAATAIMALPADAQRDRRGAGNRGWRCMSGQERVTGLVGFSPRVLLRAQERLELTDQQIEALTRLQTQSATTSAQARAALATHRAQLREALTADTPDATIVRQHLEASQEARTQLEWIGLDTMLQAKATLTDTQRASWRESVARRGSRGGMRRRRP